MPDLIRPIMDRYRNCNTNGDPAPEILSLEDAAFETAPAEVPPDGRLALVFIEPRVLEEIPGGMPAQALADRLLRFKGDLRAQGLHSRFLLARVYRGPVHQDGRTVLALRRFLQEVRQVHPRLEGVLLLGDFPESALLRRWIWSPYDDTRGSAFICISPELVSHRSDLVLADLTGNWESLYQEEVHVQAIPRAFPDAGTAATPWHDGTFVQAGVFTSEDFQLVDQVHRDVFYIDDAQFEVLAHEEEPPRLRLRIESAARNPEIAGDDRSRPNAIAKPDIAVGRLNALHVAVDPDPFLRGDDGKTFLDAQGRPQEVESAADLVPGNQSLFLTTRNPALERRLYCDYFDRNHRFRVGAFGNLPFRVAAVGGSNDLNPYAGAANLQVASNHFSPSVVSPNAHLAEYVAFLKQPAVLRFITAHSNMWNSSFQATATADQIRAEVGGDPLYWVRIGTRYRPGYDGLGGIADQTLHRALWQNQTLSRAGASIVVHNGCELNSVYGTADAPYNAQGYAHWQASEGLLFYTHTLALLSRAKVFYDSFEGFGEGFRADERTHVGSAFRHAYEVQSNDAPLARAYADNKRAYHWSISGDWSVRLVNTNGFGCLRGSEQKLEACHVHPDKAWVEGWNFDRGLNRFPCVGDLDGDGVDELVVTSDWGIGLIKHDGHRWRLPYGAPRDTWFGGWRYDATVNAGRDRILGTARLTSTAAQEILVASSWGLGCLGWNGGSLEARFLLQNGGRIGGWLLDTARNRIEGFGQFDGSAQKELLITSPWGLGILSLATRQSTLMVANQSVLAGGWRVNTLDNQVLALADLDGDGRDEILVRSPWGLGVLKVQGNTLATAAIHAHGVPLPGGYTPQNTDGFWCAADVLGVGAHQVAFANDEGLHVLRLRGSVLERVAGLGNGQRASGWLLDVGQNRCRLAADFDGDGREELLVTSPWGVGLLAWNGIDALTQKAMHAYGSTLGDWCLDSTDAFLAKGRLDPGTPLPTVLVQK